MPNHLTPDELAKEMGIDRDEVIRICIEEGSADLPREDRQDALPGVARGRRNHRLGVEALARTARPRATRLALARAGLGLLRRAGSGGRDARPERLQEVDDGRLGRRFLRDGEHLAALLRLEQGP